jgi:peptidoglycan/LPS O-acetylase OafA/YrhL
MNHNTGIQALRIIAAFLVLLQHTIVFSCIGRKIDFTPFLPINFGGMGVNLFFVISGYVMTLCLSQKKMFIFNRVARVYPGFWAAIALGAIILPLVGQEWYLDIKAFLLAPTVSLNNTLRVPYWTLIYEIVFYSVVYLGILSKLSRNQMLIALSIWALSIVLVCTFNIHPEFNDNLGVLIVGKWILFSPANLLFIAGMVYGLIGQSYLQNRHWSLIGGISVIFWIISHFAPHVALFVRYIFFAIAYVAALDLARRIKPSRILVKLGDFSYGIYLVHTIFLIALTELLVTQTSFLPTFLFFGLMMILALIPSLIFGVIEHWGYNRFIKQFLNKIPSIFQKDIYGRLPSSTAYEKH